MEDFNIDLQDSLPMTEVPIVAKEVKKPKKVKNTTVVEDEPVVSCLRNERVQVRYIPKSHGIWGNNPKHVLSGGMSEGASRTFVVPRLSKSNMFVNVLTNDEKAFLELVMGLDEGALSIYKKGHDNFWDDSNEEGINKVRLVKDDNFFDLSDPELYIKYKILLANKDFIAPSLEALEDTPKATYQFVIVSEGDESKRTNANVNKTMESFMEFGKISEDFYTLRTIVELIDGRPTSPSVKIEFLKDKCTQFIQMDAGRFLKTVKDPLLSTKVLIKRAIEAGVISNRGGQLFLRKDGTPLCGHNEEPTLNIAARFLNMPKQQDLKFSIEAQIKD